METIPVLLSRHIWTQDRTGENPQEWPGPILSSQNLINVDDHFKDWTVSNAIDSL